MVYEQIYSYFITNNYLCNNQYGFRKDHSTEHAVLEVVNRISYELDQGHTPIALFLDLSKAFDTLNHEILLLKLKHYGFTELPLDWFKNYLQNRFQYVQIEEFKSQMVSLRGPY